MNLRKKKISLGKNKSRIYLNGKNIMYLFLRVFVLLKDDSFVVLYLTRLLKVLTLQA